MRTNSKILVGMGIGLIVVAVLFVSVSAEESANISFNVTVEEGGVTITEKNTDFGTLQVGETMLLSPSFIANNTKATNANIEAQFRTNISGLYGFVGTDGNHIIPAQHFNIGTPGNMSFMDNAGNLVEIGSVTAGSETSFDVALMVPAGQPAKSYQGVIDLVISFV